MTKKSSNQRSIKSAQSMDPRPRKKAQMNTLDNHCFPTHSCLEARKLATNKKILTLLPLLKS
jgi:hypothetical protein